ncbi:yajG [Escherichia coli O25b:H4]|nr:yajG [Escherichia coli O25b:H4]
MKHRPRISVSFTRGDYFVNMMNLHALPTSPRRWQCYDGGNFYQTRLRVSESPNMFKKILFPLVALFMLAGCAKPPTTIEVSPTITLPQQDPSLMGVTVSINGADQRTDQALAKVTRDNQIVTLTASRDLRFLLQEVLEKQMTARGYMVGPNGPVNLQIIVSQLYADVSQGNVRYNIATKADIAIIATAQNGNKMTKNYRASYNVEGAFQASNKNIADAVNSVLTDTIADMSQDTSIHEFIKQNAR